MLRMRCYQEGALFKKDYEHLASISLVFCYHVTELGARYYTEIVSCQLNQCDPYLQKRAMRFVHCIKKITIQTPLPVCMLTNGDMSLRSLPSQ